MGGGGASGVGEADTSFETSLAAILDHATEAFIALDQRLQITAVNHVFESLVGRSASKMIGRPWEEMFPAAAQAVMGEQLRRSLRTGETIDFEATTETGGGRHYGVRAFPYPGGVAALIVNRTAEREMARTLHTARATEAALAALPQIMLLRLNIRGVIAEVSDGFAGLTGFSRDELLTCRLTDIVQPRDRPDLARVVENLLQGGQPQEIATTLLVKNGQERPVRIGAAAIQGELGPDGVAAAISVAG